MLEPYLQPEPDEEEATDPAGYGIPTPVAPEPELGKYSLSDQDRTPRATQPKKP